MQCFTARWGKVSGFFSGSLLHPFMTITILDIATSLNRFIAGEERDISGLDAFFRRRTL
jgi:hypothetical protein